MAGRLDSWFKTEILVHEAILMRFLGRVWPRHEEHADLRQEAYARVYEAALEILPTNPKAFLFSIARHMVVDRIRRERIVSIQAAGDNDFSNDLVEENTPERSASTWQELTRLAQAFDSLPPKCREVVWMRRVLDIPQKDVAQRLGVTEKTIEKQVCRGGRLLALYMQQAQDPNKSAPHSRNLEDLRGIDEEDIRS